jgi:hypothetical protein
MIIVMATHQSGESFVGKLEVNFADFDADTKDMTKPIEEVQSRSDIKAIVGQLHFHLRYIPRSKQ